MINHPIDVLNGFDVWGVDGITTDETGDVREVTVATNDTIGIFCGVAPRYAESVVWLGVNPESDGNLIFFKSITFCKHLVS